MSQIEKLYRITSGDVVHTTREGSEVMQLEDGHVLVCHEDEAPYFVSPDGSIQPIKITEVERQYTEWELED